MSVGGTAGGFVGYNAWSYIPIISPEAPSGTNVIASAIRGQILEGQPAFLPLNEKVKCFDMKSIRNGCFVASQVGVAVVPVSCTIQLSARSALTGRVETKPAIYNPRSLTEPFNTTTFPAPFFSCIDRVDVALISAALPGDKLITAAAFDDLSYVAYVKE